MADGSSADSLFSPEIAAFLQRLLMGMGGGGLGGNLLQLGQGQGGGQGQGQGPGPFAGSPQGDIIGVPEFGALAGSPPRTSGGGPNLNILPAPAPDPTPTRLGNALVLLGHLAPLFRGGGGGNSPLEEIMGGLRTEAGDSPGTPGENRRRRR